MEQTMTKEDLKKLDKLIDMLESYMNKTGTLMLDITNDLRYMYNHERMSYWVYDKRKQPNSLVVKVESNDRSVIVETFKDYIEEGCFSLIQMERWLMERLT